MKLSLGFGALKSGLGMLKNFPKLIGILQDAIKYIKLIELVQDSLKVPAANLMFQVRKELSGLREIAAQTETEIDDKIIDGALSAVNGLLEFFHLKDDCDKLEELDKEVSP